jgi:hypothetical protein
MNSTHQLDKTVAPRGPARDPMDRMHAPYAIARLLEAADLRYWSAPVLSLLANLDGFERYCPEDMDPSTVLRDQWTQAVATNTTIPTGQILVDICDLKIFAFRAAWINQDTKAQQLWQPLSERWLDFETRGEKNEVLQVWHGEGAVPTYEQLRAHLLAAKLAMNGIER